MKQYEKCKQYKVNDVKTVEEFLDKYMIQEKMEYYEPRA